MFQPFRTPLMKRLLLLVILLCMAPIARAQLLPNPGAKNPDWTLEKSDVQQVDGRLALPPATDRMPNAAQKSISSNGNRHSSWDADRQLAYQWLSRPGATAPEERVTVRADRTGTTYTYRRRSL